MYVNKFLVQHKKFRQAQKNLGLVKVQGIHNLSNPKYGLTGWKTVSIVSDASAASNGGK